jgi:hypothetical protein
VLFHEPYRIHSGYHRLQRISSLPVYSTTRAAISTAPNSASLLVLQRLSSTPEKGEAADPVDLAASHEPPRCGPRNRAPSPLRGRTTGREVCARPCPAQLILGNTGAFLPECVGKDTDHSVEGKRLRASENAWKA